MQPPFLKNGDSVFLLNISRKGEVDIGFVTKKIQSWGLNPLIGNTIRSNGFCQFAADKQTRLEELQFALNDPDIKAIFFCRGGYGAVQLIDEIDFSIFTKHPKWLIGYSDITYLHSHLHHQFLAQTIHGPMLFGFNKETPENLEALKKCLFGQIKHIAFTNCTTYKTNNVSGILVGGNLSILHTCIGTPSDIDTDGKILIIEDVNENLMSIERMLYALKRSGKLDKLQALLLGDFVIPIKDNETSNNIVAEMPNPTEKNIQEALHKMVLNLLSEYNYPICFDLPFGHIIGRNTSLIFGTNVQLQINKTSLELTYT